MLDLTYSPCNYATTNHLFTFFLGSPSSRQFLSINLESLPTEKCQSMTSQNFDMLCFFTNPNPIIDLVPINIWFTSWETLWFVPKKLHFARLISQFQYFFKKINLRSDNYRNFCTSLIFVYYWLVAFGNPLFG